MLGCDSEVVDPANGLCVLEVTWGECVYCCDEDAYWDSVITETAAIVALAAIGNPWLAAPAGALGIMTGTPNDCIRKVCTGKPGDPQPHGCADGQGICMFACPQQNGIPGSTGDCPSHAVCCATTY